MCVLSFVPRPHGNFVLTNNRDENIARLKALPPAIYKINGQKIAYPQDPQASGTWIASSHRYTLCLLNGAFQNHISRKPYRYSRGKVILDFFESPQFFKSDFNGTGFENFTLFVIDSQAQSLIRWVWDGENLHEKILDWNKPHIWSSATLYSQAVIEKRQELFADFLQNYPQPSNEQLVDFHVFTKTGNVANDFVMLRPDGTQTQCLTQISKEIDSTQMYFLDLIDKQESTIEI